MKSPSNNSLLEYMLLCVVAIVTVVITPNVVFDPIALPKFVVLATGGLAFGAVILRNGMLSLKNGLNPFRILLALIALDLILICIFAGTNIYRSLYGTSGRGTGFLTYISLLAILALASNVSSLENIKRFAWLLVGLSLISAMYGFAQWKDLDPIDWKNKYGPVVGLFGNPNFQSGFLGIAGAAIVGLLSGKGLRLAQKVGLLGTLLLDLSVIKFTQSSQGVFIFVAGLASVLVLKIVYTKKKILYVPALVVSAIGFILFFLSLISVGPLKSSLVDSNLYARRFFWKAAWNMTIENPLLGVGFDGFIDWYRRARPVEAVPAGFFSDTAHNIYLDLASSGGFPIILLYLALQVFVLISVIRLVSRSISYDSAIGALIAAWVGYQVFSLVSINQLGIAIWGWVIPGLIIGYEFNTRVEVTNAPVVNTKKGTRVKSVPVGLTLTIGAAIGAMLSLPSYVASANYINALKLGQIQPLKDAAFSKPIDEQRIVGVARLLTENKLNKDALEIAVKATEYFPDSSFAWQALAAIPDISASQLAHANSELKRLDPNNKNL